MMFSRAFIAGFSALAFGACGGAAVQSDSESPDTDGDGRTELGDRPTSRRSAVPGMENGDGNSDVEVEGLRGYIDQYDINRAIQKSQRALAMCVGEGQADNPYLAGKVEFAFVVGQSGAVKSVTLTKNDIGSWTVEKCLLGAANAIKFARPKGGDAFFSVPLEFEPTKRPMWWGEDRIQTSISEEQMATVAACGDKAGDLENVWLTLYVDTKLAVTSTGFAWSKNPVASEWADCVAEATSQWTLSGPPTNTVSKLSFRYDKAEQ